MRPWSCLTPDDQPKHIAQRLAASLAGLNKIPAYRQMKGNLILAEPAESAPA